MFDQNLVNWSSARQCICGWARQIRWTQVVPLFGNPVLFKKCTDIDVFDIELAENDPEKLIDIIVELASTLSSAPTPSGRDR